MQEENLLRFRCRVGHAFSSESLLLAQKDALENALWSALRGLEEQAKLARRVATCSRASNNDIVAQRLEERAQKAEQHAKQIRQFLLKAFS